MMMPSREELVSFASSLAFNVTLDLRGNLDCAAAFLRGHSIYQGTLCFLPFPLVFPYALLSLLPLWLAWGIVLLVNVSILISLFRYRALLWVLYAPTLYLVVSGQNDLFFVFFERQLTRGTRSAILAALTTLKPQLAIVLLPFHLHRWWREDRRTLGRFAAFTAILWFTPWSWAEWFAKVRTSTSNLRCAPSIWAACRGTRVLPLPTIVLAAVSLLLVHVAFKSKRREVALPALEFATPVGMGYNTAMLTGLAPAWVMLPLSWIIGLYIVLDPGRGLDAFALLPLAVLVYQRSSQERKDESS